MSCYIYGVCVIGSNLWSLGQLYDASSNQPVPGLELVLGPPSHPNLYDTVVMANLGYFQLKASPGAWQLQIREGRSRAIYTIAGCVISLSYATEMMCMYVLCTMYKE